MTDRLISVVETPEFQNRAKAVGMTEADRDQLAEMLARNPDAGVSLGSGLRKVRFARQGKGKSGGYRVLHFYRHEGLPVFLLTVFSKNEKVNLSRSEQAELAKLCDQIAGSYGRAK